MKKILKISLKIKFIFFYSIKIISFKEFPKYQEKLLDPSFKGGVTASLEEVLHLNKLNAKNFTYQVCEESILSIPIGIIFPKNSFLSRVFNEKLRLLKANGLIGYWLGKYIDMSYFNVKKPYEGPKALTVEHFKGCFLILIIGLGISALVAVIEKSLKIFKKIFYLLKLKKSK